MENLRLDERITKNEGKYYIVCKFFIALLSKTFKNCLPDYYIIHSLTADSGYSPSPILLLKVPDAVVGSAEDKYNNAICSTRSQIERTFGIWTNVWRGVKRERKLLYCPERVKIFIMATVVLHNYIRLNGYIKKKINFPYILTILLYLF